ncbi:molybdopterin molybdotransferase [Mameliella alba]|uniref:molybdopterin molybdotransferase MoeA n=1 Tax=Mameliella alba TaxID=561184 RepID=UPI00087F8513|nr:gephyrin-like molybdotransferase Glp [Mameliella alba]OWV50414.1 molybdopterin molybdenumtransferase MoeA [Mameliella alba]PTR42175.1 molybdopterin molybdotransferase [Mameliella alba]GGF55645.1 molybdopterin molybdenumtransferase MoeA [Mameliella alba]SDC01064.1 molybdopterin molybdotransferase [Mameliella alba]
MISVSEALDQLFALAAPLPVETVPLVQAAGRVLARPVTARRDQPPFPASAMDGYAVAESAPGQRLTVIGESAAGTRFEGSVGPGQAVRIFTGAPVPEGATRIVIQEDVTRDGESITLHDDLDENPYIRPAGTDFRIGQTVEAPRLLTPQDVALLAAMNIAEVPVTRKPRVALISTGDELVMPGDTPGPDQIIASNTFGLHALLRDLGAEPRILPIARDTSESLIHGFSLVGDADLVVTIGGASVGDHDLVARVAGELGMERAFHKVAMRPGKPLMSGRLQGAMMVGLPGNPVSAMVCGHVFLAPVIRAMLGLGTAPAPRLTARLSAPLTQNGPREHYMRAQLDGDGIRALDRQDSSLLSVLGKANALLVRPVGDAARQIGDTVDYLPL